MPQVSASLGHCAFCNFEQQISCLLFACAMASNTSAFDIYGSRWAPTAMVGTSRVYQQNCKVPASSNFCKNGEMEKPTFFNYFVWAV